MREHRFDPLVWGPIPGSSEAPAALSLVVKIEGNGFTVGLLLGTETIGHTVSVRGGMGDLQ
jgi:hypothetical protein